MREWRNPWMQKFRHEPRPRLSRTGASYKAILKLDHGGITVILCDTHQKGAYIDGKHR